MVSEARIHFKNANFLGTHARDTLLFGISVLVVGLWIHGYRARFQTPATNSRLMCGRRVASGIETLGSTQLSCYSNYRDAQALLIIFHSPPFDLASIKFIWFRLGESWELVEDLKCRFEIYD
jgi:hypothetical protein